MKMIKQVLAKTKTIRIKTWIFGLIFLTIILSSMYAFHSYVINEYERFEVNEFHKDVELVMNFLDSQIGYLERLNTDWAYWDDTYYFIENKSKDYIESNLVNETFIEQKLNLIVFINRNKSIVYAKAFDFEKNRVIPVPELSPYLDYLANESSGFLKIDGEVLMFSSKRIIKSDGSGDPRGWLVMGRFVNDSFFRALGMPIGINIYIDRSDHNQTISIQDGKLITYRPIKDVTGKNLFFLVFEKKSNLEERKAEFHEYFSAVFFIGIAFLGIGSAIYHISINERIIRLNRELDELAKKGDISGRVTVDGEDGIAELARNINLVLESVENYQKSIENARDILATSNKILRHDMLNNLTVLRGLFELIEDDRREIGFRAIDRSLNLIDEMRDMEQSVNIDKLQVYDLKDVIESIASGYDIEVNVNCTCKVIADPAIYSVFDNLIRNAIQHGKTDRVDITCRKLNGFCEVRVADYGTGIPDEIKNMIFEEGFKYGEKAGTGLGMYIVKKLMERYGGSVAVEDNKPKGTTFVLKFRCVE
ncbi:hypothetical protein Asulf_01766 [Archaeoglobus sulfaticallidus PM70-1]|uniref:histidine kinase n=1 Tax=Archaeoglobus sulfaticallidus PM70-1 TaxID=387631 RepID=N0BHE0_9EURY|nr:CHASE4 domain-containing protein [Archaeoglobus sulfaticallidus]AGK61737.1 hypothetical protein Asulf_01766 [Archaeoglobus sulfaticallidus PM70-1]